MRRLSLTVLLATAVLSPTAARAQTVKPRFLLLIDNSGSMLESAATRVRTHGDGSQAHPGCDLDTNGKYDDSKLYQAKAALNETVAAFGSVEFSLARYHANELGQICNFDRDCTILGMGANICVGGRCAYRPPNGAGDYTECTGGTATGNGCIRCATAGGGPNYVYSNGTACCPANSPKSGGFGIAGDVIVAFPPAGVTNTSELLMWMDGVEDFPFGTNKELRASTTTPIGGALNGVRDWLVNDASTVGAGAGILNRDPQIGCRSYNVVLVTDGLEVGNCVNTCGINAARAAALMYHSCTHGGLWDAVDARCEIAGDPNGTAEVRVKTYVVGFTVNDPSLNAVAAAGGTGTALLANNQAELAARLGDIVAASIPTESCDCQDNTCDGKVDETFVTKGATCTVGIGRCKRQGQFGCSADGSGVVCASSPSGICPAAELVPGVPLTEQCGAAPNCEAPTPEDCADDNCNGLVDENMSCSCVAKPEICNGLDDDCNGAIDDIASVSCGLNIGECRPGMTACVDDGQGGKKTVCNGGTTPVPELCDGKDNDCDGVTDGFGLGCYPADATGCTLNVTPTSCASVPREQWQCAGVCAPGLLTCTQGTCGMCAGAVTPTTEVACDKLDNDCDGEVDEGFNIGGGCGPGLGGIGECRAGALQCVDNALKCVGGQGPIDEICNGKDDDCDGMVDNLPGSCGPTLGECRAGKPMCSGTQTVCNQPMAPTGEICNGKDDDCNGLTDDDPKDADLLVTTACGSAVGICRPGVLRCIGGMKSCEGGVQAEIERCNNVDDDCDGMVDNGIAAPGPCPPPGLMLGSPVVGECVPAMNVCEPDGVGGALWRCVGGVGPAAEACDGKDNDCDGTIDNGARCADDANFGCFEGSCLPRCASTEPECPANDVCKDGLCQLAECAKKACPKGFACDVKRGCVDRCEKITCPVAGTHCEDGVCTNCHATGCPSGQVCRLENCEPDPCAAKTCATGEYCRAGSCVKGCQNINCAFGKSCRDGFCEIDKCSAKPCPQGQVCQPKDGRCVANQCASIQCLPGQVCVPDLAKCVVDPCLVTTCAGDDICVMQTDGLARCLTRQQLAATYVAHVTAAGAGCVCGLGEGRQRGGGTMPWLVALAVPALVRRRRRRR